MQEIRSITDAAWVERFGSWIQRFIEQVWKRGVRNSSFGAVVVVWVVVERWDPPTRWVYERCVVGP